MVNNNLIIPKGNIAEIAKVTEVRYLDENYQPQSYEEFMKTYEPSEKVEIITETEYRDRLLHGPQYGPGNEQSKTVAKFVGKVAISTVGAGAIIATGGAAAPIVLSGVTLGAGGKVMKEVAKDKDNEFFEWVRDTMFDTGLGTLAGSIAGGGSSSLASHIGRSGKIGGSAVSDSMKLTKETYDAISGSIDCVYGAGEYYHAEHRDNGFSYKSDCPVCICGD